MNIIGRFSRGVRGRFVLAALFTLLSIVFSFLVPQVIRFTVDSVIGTEESSLPQLVTSLLDSLGGREMLRANLIFCSLGIVVFALLNSVFSYLSRITIAKGTEKFTKSLRDSLFSHIQHLPFSWHVENQTGDIIQRCISDVETLRGFISTQLGEVARTILLLAAALALMFSMHTKLALICLATIPLIILYTTLFFGRISRQFLVADEAEGELTVQVQENLTGVRVVRSFGRERYERERFT